MAGSFVWNYLVSQGKARFSKGRARGVIQHNEIEKRAGPNWGPEKYNITTSLPQIRLAN